MGQSLHHLHLHDLLGTLHLLDLSYTVIIQLHFTFLNWFKNDNVLSSSLWPKRCLIFIVKTRIRETKASPRRFLRRLVLRQGGRLFPAKPVPVSDRHYGTHRLRRRRCTQGLYLSITKNIFDQRLNTTPWFVSWFTYVLSHLFKFMWMSIKVFDFKDFWSLIFEHLLF